MKVKIERKFLKDLESLDKITSEKLQVFLNTLLNVESFWDLKMRKMKWYKNYFRIRLWDYRIWLKVENDICICVRVKHRKDIYKIFP